MRVSRWADAAAQPWKNGGGVTHELWRAAGVGDPGFTVRVSVATVASDGPFSSFPGVDRVITLIEGRGFHLVRPDGSEVAVTAVGAPFAFAGEDPFHCRLVDGPVHDLNVMVARDGFRVEVAPADGWVDLGPQGLVFALRPTGGLGRWDLLHAAGRVGPFHPGDALAFRLEPSIS